MASFFFRMLSCQESQASAPFPCAGICASWVGSNRGHDLIPFVRGLFRLGGGQLRPTTLVFRSASLASGVHSSLVRAWAAPVRALRALRHAETLPVDTPHCGARNLRTHTLHSGVYSSGTCVGSEHVQLAGAHSLMDH